MILALVISCLSVPKVSAAKTKTYWLAGVGKGYGFADTKHITIKLDQKKRTFKLSGYACKAKKKGHYGEYKKINKTFQYKKGLKIKIGEDEIFYNSIKNSVNNGYLQCAFITMKIKGNTIVQITDGP